MSTSEHGAPLAVLTSDHDDRDLDLVLFSKWMDSHLPDRERFLTESSLSLVRSGEIF